MSESLCCPQFPSHPKKCSSLGASARRSSARGAASMLEPVISGLAKSILRNFLRVLARRRMGSMGCLRPLIWQRSVAQERVEFAENFYQIAGKSRSRRGGGSPFTKVFRELYPLLRYTSLRSEEHTSELQSRGHLVCRL